MAGTKIKKDDTVKVIAGSSKGSTGKVQYVDRKKGKVIIAGVNMVTKAVKKKSQEDRGA